MLPTARKYYLLFGCDSFGSTEYDIRIINDKSTRVILTVKNVLDGIAL
ncbi:3-oxoacyl-[acyl-carrier protein] reductase [Richelia intracellularis]|nr:3-oxoacyl-[acyl-carrier protein] reductase [Richelia intracellularis]